MNTCDNRRIFGKISSSMRVVHTMIYRSFSIKLLQWLISYNRNALKNIPLERPAMPGRDLINPVCGLVNAKWLGVEKKVPQFQDGIYLEFKRNDDDYIEFISQERLLPGDVLICCPEGGESQSYQLVEDKISNSVRVFTRGIFTHAAIVGHNNFVYEAALPVVQATPYIEWLKNFKYIVVLRHDLASEKNARENMIKYMENQVGKRYNVARAIGMMLLGNFYTKNWQSKIFEILIAYFENKFYKNNHVCSTFVWSALARAGITDENSSFGKYVTPSDFIDGALLQPVGWALWKGKFAPHKLDTFAVDYIISDDNQCKLSGKSNVISITRQ